MPRNKPTVFFRDSVFRLSAKPKVFCSDLKPNDSVRRVSVTLTEDEVAWLDCSCCNVRRNGQWNGITRSNLLRALVQAVSEKPLALSGVSNESELVDALKRVFYERSEGVATG